MSTATHVIDDLEKRVRAALPDGRLRGASLSMVEVARRAGVHVVTVQKFKLGLLNLRPRTIERLANVLGLKLELVDAA